MKNSPAAAQAYLFNVDLMTRRPAVCTKSRTNQRRGEASPAPSGGGTVGYTLELGERRHSLEEKSCDIGLIGLAVMGQNLVLNMNDHGFRVAVFGPNVWG